MLDPCTDVLVADIDVADKSPDAGNDMDAKCLHEWVLTRRGQKDPQIRTIGKLGISGRDGGLDDRLVVGFAIWNVRKPYQEETITTKSAAIPKRPKQSWAAWLEGEHHSFYIERVGMEAKSTIRR